MTASDTQPQPHAWPFGHGVLMTAVAITEGIACWWLMACPDGFTQDSGKDKQESWDEALRLDAPRIVLTFRDDAAIDRAIEDLQELKAMRRG